MRLCRVKIRRAKAQLELNLATAVKSVSVNTPATKGGLRRISILCWIRGTKAEVLNVFLASVSNSKISHSRATQPPELGDRGQNEAPIVQEEMVSNLLHHLDTHKSTGLDGIHPPVPRQLVEELAKPLSIIYHQF